jgi:hypothetical protein
MSDLIGFVFIAVISEALFTELPVHYIPEVGED